MYLLGLKKYVYVQGFGNIFPMSTKSVMRMHSRIKGSKYMQNNLHISVHTGIQLVSKAQSLILSAHVQRALQ